MQKEYTLEYLLKTFTEHSIQFQKDNPLADFDLPKALATIIEEIIDLKRKS